MILTKHEETKKGRLFHENEILRIFVSSCSINLFYQHLSAIMDIQTLAGRFPIEFPSVDRVPPYSGSKLTFPFGPSS